MIFFRGDSLEKSLSAQDISYSRGKPTLCFFFQFRDQFLDSPCCTVRQVVRGFTEVLFGQSEEVKSSDIILVYGCNILVLEEVTSFLGRKEDFHLLWAPVPRAKVTGNGHSGEVH